MPLRRGPLRSRQRWRDLVLSRELPNVGAAERRQPFNVSGAEAIPKGGNNRHDDRLSRGLVSCFGAAIPLRSC